MRDSHVTLVKETAMRHSLRFAHLEVERFQMLSWIVLFRCFAGVEVPFTEVLWKTYLRLPSYFCFLMKNRLKLSLMSF